MKKVLLVLLALVLVLTFAASFFLVRFGTADSINQRKWNSETALSYLRGKVRQYHETTGEFPSSLGQMEAYFVHKTGERWGPNREWISSDEGNDRESVILDGNGGWYYNREAGELRINLNKCLKDYFKHYYRLDRYDRPCDW